MKRTLGKIFESILWLFLGLLAFTVIVLTAAAIKDALNTPALEDSSRFSKEICFMGADSVTVITDSKTGQQYIFYNEGYAGGLTQLEK